MIGITTVAVSLAFISTTSFVLISCMSCRKFAEKRRQKKQRKEERVNIPDIKIDIGQTQDENGIANPVYQENEENKANEEQAEAKAEVAGNGVKEGNEEEKVEIEEKVNKEEQKENTEEDSKAQKVEEEKVSTEVAIGVVNSAFQEINEKEQEPSKDEIDEQEVLADVQKEQQEPSQEEETEEKTTQENDRNESPKFEPTQLFENNLSEEELEAYKNVVFQGEWRQPVSLGNILEMGLIDKACADTIVKERKEKDDGTQKDGEDGTEEEVPEVLKKFIRGEEPVAGIIVAESGEKRSIFKSAKDGILRRGTAISLLEAQAATGNIIDPVTGRKMSVKEATQLGLLDRVYETVLLRAERAVTGYKFRASDHVLSLYEAMQKGLVVESHGLRLLEAQCATGGVIDHNVNIRVPIDVAVKRGLLDEKLREKLEDEDGEETKTFFDPNTEENVTYRELMRRSVVDNDTGLRLFLLEKITKKRMSYGSYSGRSSQSSSRTVSRSNSRENLPAAVASSS